MQSSKRAARSRGTFTTSTAATDAAARDARRRDLRGDADITWGEWLSVQAPKVKNSPLWATNPKQQLGYLQVKNWARLYCPGAILGVYTPEDLAEREPGDGEPPRSRGPRRKSDAAAAWRARSAAATAQPSAGTATTTTDTASAPRRSTAAGRAPRKAGPAGTITVNQVAYLRNKLKSAGAAEQSICDRFQVAGIEHLSAGQFDTVKAELLAAV
jgi:hypothetical protein